MRKLTLITIGGIVWEWTDICTIGVGTIQSIYSYDAFILPAVPGTDMTCFIENKNKVLIKYQNVVSKLREDCFRIAQNSLNIMSLWNVIITHKK